MDPSRRGLLSQPSFRDHEADVSSEYNDSDLELDTADYLGSSETKLRGKNRRRTRASKRSPSASSPSKSRHNAAFHAYRGATFGGIDRWIPFRRRTGRKALFCVLAVAGFAGLMLLAASSVVWHYYNQAPPDGLSPPWYPTPKGGSVAGRWKESYAKASTMVARMTLPEKVNVTTGTGWSMGLAVGRTGPAVNVGFPALHLQDGPLGIRMADNITAWPAGITVGATWNRELMYLRGQAHAAEAKQKGVNAILGPCVGPLGRMPAGGRNWEGFGADPYLQGIAGAETIRGIQDEGIMATVKHFVGNEQEHFRQSWEWGLANAISSNIDDRALHELYAWPFGDAVRAGAVSVMCSYNMVNNSYACGNSKLLNGVLKDELGFQGFVMSDWLAQRSGVASALAGLDMSMPGDGLRWADGKALWGPEMTRAVLNGSLPLTRLDDMVTRIVASWFQMGQDDEDIWPRDNVPNFSSFSDEKMGVAYPGSDSPQELIEVNQFVNVRSQNHSDLARLIAAEGTVLLRNDDDVLPLSRDGGVGKSERPSGRKFRVGIFGEDAGPGQGPNFCKDRGCNQGTLGSGWGSGAVEFPYLVSPIEALRREFDASKVLLSEYLTNTPPSTRKMQVYGEQDLCIVFANADSGEGFLSWEGHGGDRKDLFLQKGGDDVIVDVAKGCGGPTVVVLHTVGPVVVEKWIGLSGVKAVVLGNLPGQESGWALADVLFGRINPSGKLPYTMGKKLEDWGKGGKVMYLPNAVVPQQDFSEGLYIDYRHFDKHGIAPRFPFGFGLSYTTFAFSNITVTEVKAKSPLPSPRPEPGAIPPSYNDQIPDKGVALFPSAIRRLNKYIYPYLDSVSGISVAPYPSLPDGYHVHQQPSEAGGAEGGNPDLWETYVAVTAEVKNTGSRGGQAVAQLYLSYPEAGSAKTLAGEPVDFPVKVLRGFEKVYIEAGESTTVTFNITRRDLSYWDVERQNWVLVTEGKYRFTVAGDGGEMVGGVSSEW